MDVVLVSISLYHTDWKHGDCIFILECVEIVGIMTDNYRSMYFSAFIFPLTLQRVPGPYQVIHVQLKIMIETLGLHFANMHSGLYASWKYRKS